MFKSQWFATDTTASPNSDQPSSVIFQIKDLTKVGDLDILDGTDLINDMKTFFNKKKVEKSLRTEWKLADADGENHTSAHLILEIPDGAIPNPVDLPNPSNTKFWNYEDSSDLIDLSMTCNWRFTSVNRGFGRVVRASKWSLFIYSDVGSSGVVGNQVTDLLREVSYKREGKGSQYFEPLHIQYIPVRKDVLDIIETQVAETTGDLTQFGSGNTIVTLHFKKT